MCLCVYIYAYTYANTYIYVHIYQVYNRSFHKRKLYIWLLPLLPTSCRLQCPMTPAWWNWKMDRIWLTNMKSVEGGILCDIAFRVSSGKNAEVDWVGMVREPHGKALWWVLGLLHQFMRRCTTYLRPVNSLQSFQRHHGGQRHKKGTIEFNWMKPHHLNCG